MAMAALNRWAPVLQLGSPAVAENGRGTGSPVGSSGADTAVLRCEQRVSLVELARSSAYRGGEIERSMWTSRWSESHLRHLHRQCHAKAPIASGKRPSRNEPNIRLADRLGITADAGTRSVVARL